MAKVPSARVAPPTTSPSVSLLHREGSHAASASLMVVEEEIKMSEVENNLRQTCLELCKPTILRMTLVHGEMQETKKQMEELAGVVKEIDASVQTVLARSEYIQVLKTGLEDTTARLRETDSRLTANGKVFRERISVLESDMESQHNWNDKIDRSFERMTQDVEDQRIASRAFKESVETSFTQVKEIIAAEVAGVRGSIKELETRMNLMNDDIWGADRPDECSPPSLRRLDWQMRKVQSRVVDALRDLTALRRLEVDMKDISKEQDQIREAHGGIEKGYNILKERVESMGREVKEESRIVANRMAAFSASLMKDVRGTFGEEVKNLQGMQSEMKNFVQDTKTAVDNLDKVIMSVRKHVEAVLREMRVDLDSADSKRKRDKQGLQDDVSSLQGRVQSSLEAAESTLKGLEHMSKVLGMALQGQRVSIALDIQDFVDRKEAPYVGVKAPLEKPKAHQGKSPRKDADKPRRREGLDPSSLMRLPYQPTPVSFQGSEFDRAQLLELREKVVHAAQQALLHGPSARTARGAFPLDDSIPNPLAPAALGAYVADGPLASGRRSAPPGSRPGSRAQPSARGSPLQEESWPTPKDTPQPGKDARTCPTPDAAGSTAKGRMADSPETLAGGMHLPALAPTASAEVSRPRQMATAR
mmetsp:Transcript_52540/g.151433  ORF Transcript_52540/g.151433 Transcript_52540/m.151433 type:complete len:646 (+) Transcript_52540:154-2091(+)|eukprot:CAMPEP_0176054570 /NCGR_PEP_ID=MMETSP0120_2-20121206/27152_1 /TAXON_ID=160619 /ORGANISM="Kryptoperidinium foliaceum, Strain CCMP 1326" /LENGTH=645 /DNA_ID=CAMNT_0017388037 /DNA_START=80 /DNA_END=2017 /DNA_ORIENTATION=+